MERFPNSQIRNYVLQNASVDLSEEVITMFKDSMEHLQCLALAETDSEDEEEDESDITLILSMIDELFRDQCRATLDRIQAITNMILELPTSILQPYSQNYLSHWLGSRITLENWTEQFPDEIYLEYFRFEKSKFESLAEALELPETMIFGRGYRTNRMEALHILLRRLAYPNRYIDLAEMFQLRPQYLSVVFNGTVAFLFNKWGNFIRSLDHPWLNPESLASYNRAFQSSGCPLASCVATIDGTKHCFCRPGHNLQEACYCGHWHEHALSYQFLQLPNGLHLTFGPFNGFEHDSTSVKLIDLEDKLCDKFRVDGSDYCVFLDSGYALSARFITPYSRKRVLTPEEKAFNRRMSTLRQPSEWGIGKVKSLFSYLEYKRNLRILSMPLGMIFLVASHLTNIHTTIYGSQVADFFGMTPPVLTTYLGYDD